VAHDYAACRGLAFDESLQVLMVYLLNQDKIGITDLRTRKKPGIPPRRLADLVKTGS